MNEQFQKYLNDILWWCPFKKVRHIIREYINYNNELRNRINIIENQNYELKKHIENIKNQNNIILKNILFDHQNTIIIKMDGGLADQFGYYRVGKSLEKLYNKIVLYDINWYKINGLDSDKINKRNFELLNIFYDLKFDIASDIQIEIAKQNLYYSFYDYNIIHNKETKSLYFSKVIETKEPLCIHGVLPSILDIDNMKLLDYKDIFDLDKYFLPILNDNNKNIYHDIINSKNSIACHIRRTDYINHPFYIDLPPNYYKKAIDMIHNKVNDKIKVFFFSDDLEWVKENVIPIIENIYDYKIVDINSNEEGYFDFYLISKCNHQIVSSGGFARTASEFNTYKYKIVINSGDIQF